MERMRMDLTEREARTLYRCLLLAEGATRLLGVLADGERDKINTEARIGEGERARKLRLKLYHSIEVTWGWKNCGYWLTKGW